jgi:hypothetical protein
MKVNLFNAGAVLAEVAKNIDMLPEEKRAIEKRFNALAVATMPPVWGYAGMLLALVNDKDVKDVFDVYATINEWRRDPELTGKFFLDWNAERLAKS